MPNVRYDRQKNIIPQEKMEKVKVAVIGVGALGTAVANQLVRMGVGNIWLFDNDRFEIHNSNRQDFLERDVGKNKAIATAELLTLKNKDVKIFAQDLMIITPEQIPKDLDYIFGCVDNYRARKIISDYVKKVNKKCIVIDGGTNESVFTQGTVICMGRKESGRNIGDENIEYKDFIENFGEKLQKEDNTPSCSENPSQQIITTSVIVATHMADLFRQYVEDPKVFYKGTFLIQMFGGYGYDDAGNCVPTNGINYFPLIKAKPRNPNRGKTTMVVEQAVATTQ